MLRSSFRTLASVLTVFAFSAVATACNDSPTEEVDPADAVEAMRLTVGSQTININSSGTVTGGPIALPRGNVTVTGSFLDGAGAVVGGLEEFRLEVTIGSATLASFTRTAAFTGTLTGLAAGSTTVNFSLFHVAEGHDDFGPFPVSMNVS